ncbi:hypothetical protein V490_08918 [Pseudogymnoascus sp. VKM F-3557]|nr:hypothetical protein V490_08918 [Pseudogymnoascus sp. VKM F-3557]
MVMLWRLDVADASTPKDLQHFPRGQEEYERLARKGYSDKQLTVLAMHSLNGRQIKNAVRLAHAIASSDGTHLCYSHLETVLEVGKEFENDFRGSGEMANMLSYA